MNRSASAPLESEEQSLALLVERLTARLQRGEAVDLSEEMRGHPEHAEQLELIWPALAALAELERSGRIAPPDGGEASHGELGDFRLIGEVGRGGMGIVYEAEQISLRRRVALKVLPFAATMDPRHLQRFQNEARAAASLHHEHIVPVYAVGQERGVHYYAMQFIDGQTLAGFLQERERGALAEQTTNPERSSIPAAETTVAATTSATRRGGAAYFRRVAEWGIDAAEALEHAHGLGVVHRDIKPGNLMIDGQGKLWVTDFGLARTAADAGLTMTGDVVGTLRYMSPEQALAKHGVVDHRTDVYALGATLYELLTGVPVVEGQHRPEILRRIAEDEPKPLRRWNRAIPRDLETVVHKALSKEPGQRYGTAREFAQDLRRWLEHEPVRARRATLGQRAVRWGRRHPVAVRSAAVALLILVAGFSWGVRDLAARRAETERVAAEIIAEAHRLRGRHRLSEALALARQAEGLLAQSGSHPQLELRVRQLQDDLHLLRRLEHVWLTGGDLRFVKANYDEAYATAFREFGIDFEAVDVADATERVRAREARAELAAHLDSWATMRRSERGEKDTLWRKLLGAARLADPDDRRNEIRDAVERGDVDRLVSLADGDASADLPGPTVTLLGDALVRANRVSKALSLLRRSQLRHPDDFEVNNLLAHVLGKVASPPQPREAISFFRGALALRPDSAAAYNNLGTALLQSGRCDEAIDVYREAIRLEDGFALAHYNLGVALSDKGQLAEAIDAWREAIRLDPSDADPHHRLARALKSQGRIEDALTAAREAIRWTPTNADSHYILGDMLQAKGRPDDAIDAYREALRIKPDHASARTNLGVALASKGREADARDEWRRAVESKPDYAAAHTNLARLLATSADPRIRDPKNAVTHGLRAVELTPEDGQGWNALGAAYYRNADWKNAVKALTRATELTNGGDASDWLFLALASWRAGDKDQARTWYDKAATWMDSNKTQDEQLKSYRARVAAQLGLGPQPNKESPPPKP